MKLHPVTAPYKGFARGVGLGSTLLFFGFFATEFAGIGGTGVLFSLALIGFVIGAGYEIAYFQRFEYEITPDTVDIGSGVVSRRHREIPLRRIQNVDISRNLVQRTLGIAEIRLETAGGGETEASLRYVDYDEAKRLQREIRERKRDAERDEDDDREEAAATEGETVLFELGTGELLLLSAMSFNSGFGLLFGVVLPLLTGIGSVSPETVGFLLRDGPLVVLAVAVAALVVFVAIVWAFSAVRTFVRYYGFRLSRVGDELQYERGLLQRYDGSIPLDKIQALTFRENVLKRRIGYATLGIETAGYSPGQAPSGGSEAAVPLAKRHRTEELARSIEEFGNLAFERPPARSRYRYASRYTIAIGVVTAGLFAVDAAVASIGYWYAPLALVPFVPGAAHFKWVHRGYHTGDEHFVTRNGFWRRRIRVVPYYRIQTVVETRSYFQRRWRLASVTADTAGTLSLLSQDAVAVDYDETAAARIRDDLGDRLQRSLQRRKAARRARSRRARIGPDSRADADPGSHADGPEVSSNVGPERSSNGEEERDDGPPGDANGDGASEERVDDA